MESSNNYPNLIKFDRSYPRVENVITREKATINDVYVFNIKLLPNDEIMFEVYSEEKPTFFYYKLKVTIDELKNAIPLFQSKNNINDIYDEINKIINGNNYSLKFEDSSNKIIVIFLYINNEQVKISLPKEKIEFEPNYNELRELYKQCLLENANLVNYIKQKEHEIEELKKENQENLKKIKALEKKIK